MITSWPPVEEATKSPFLMICNMHFATISLHPKVKHAYHHHLLTSKRQTCIRGCLHVCSSCLPASSCHRHHTCAELFCQNTSHAVSHDQNLMVKMIKICKSNKKLPPASSCHRHHTCAEYFSCCFLSSKSAKPMTKLPPIELQFEVMLQQQLARTQS